MAETQVFPDQVRRPDVRRKPKKEEPVPIVHDHDKSYYAYLRKKQSGKPHYDHIERYDLFDYDNPQSDSDYDDMDEYTGKYHDDDPERHPSQHVRHQYSDDQYFRSRERYFPEESYHAAG